MPHRLSEAPDDVAVVVTDLRDRVLELIEHPSPDAEGAAEDLRHRAVELEVPTVALLARLARLVARLEAADFDGALADYLTALRERATFAAYVDPEVDRLGTGLGTTIVASMIATPSVAAEQVESTLDAMEAEHRRSGIAVGSVHVSRARWAAERGDLAAVRAYLADWAASPDDGLCATCLPIHAEVELRAAFDPLDALRALAERRPAGEGDESAGTSARLDALHARLLVETGDEAAALGVARRLVAGAAPEVLESRSIEHDLVRALESVPALARPIADRLADGIDEFEPADMFATAAVARCRLLGDPASADGTRRRGLAFAHAAAFDARNGSDRRTRTLRERYFPPTAAA